MNYYIVQFKSTLPVKVRAWDRNRAITEAVRERRGYLSKTEMRRQVTSVKKVDY